MTDQSDDRLEHIERDLSPITRLTRDLRQAARTLSDTEARYLVDTYYAMQKNRIRANNQIRAMGEAGEPHEVVVWFAQQSDVLERQVKGALQHYVAAHPAGEWCLAQKGIGPVIAAGILARIDIRKARTVGKIWRFAGLDPTVSWGAGQKRPWNGALKRICWLAGEAFVKQSGREGAFYADLYRERKALEERKNRAGDYALTARETLARKKIGEDTDARLWYAGCLSAEAAAEIASMVPEKRQAAVKRLADVPGSGVEMLPPARIHERAKRWAVKLFLAHLHEVWYRAEFGEAPPAPYPLAYMGHADKIEPPGRK